MVVSVTWQKVVFVVLYTECPRRYSCVNLASNLPRLSHANPELKATTARVDKPGAGDSLRIVVAARGPK
jgi:hypothetical protein